MIKRPALFAAKRKFAIPAAQTSPSSTNAKTAILMLNMGGPRNLPEVEPFLRRLFLDRDIINLPMQNYLGPWIAKRRAPKVAAKYKEIGGKSPIHFWTEKQGKLLVEKLNEVSPGTAPHQYYIGFRYAEPLLEHSLEQIERDGVTSVIAFSQYAQYCCNTTGSSINSLARYYLERNIEKPPFRLSFVDRWPQNPGLVAAFKSLIENELKQFPAEKRDSVLLLFTAHSLPLSSVNVGDTYPMEVSATVMQVMQSMNFRHPYRLVWQSKVGPLPWQGPSTPDSLKGFVQKGFKNILMIPISFVNEHIETLHELDIEYCDELASTLPIERIRRCPTPNDHPEFIAGLVGIIVDHLKSNQDVSAQLMAQCPLCTKEVCATTRQWLAALKKQQRN